MPIDLDELERLEREATQGPWCVETITHHSDCGQHSIDEYHLYEVYEDYPPLAALGAHPDAGHDVKLIAALRNAAPALIAELRAARKRIAELEPPAKVDPDLLQMAMRIAAGHADSSDAWSLLEEVERLRKRVNEMGASDA